MESDGVGLVLGGESGSEMRGCYALEYGCHVAAVGYCMVC